ADVYLSDTDAPQLTNVTHSGVSIAQANWSYSNWVDTEKPGVSVTATAGGLGIQSFQVPNNYGVLTTVPPPSGSCAGTKSSPCPTSSQISLGYDAGLMPNGITITGVVAQDPLAKADSRTWVMRVDHSAPTISLSGGLTPALTDNPYAVHVDATDGNAADTSGAQWQSGVKQIKLYRDGNLVKDTGVQSCTATAGSCPLSLDYDLGSNPPSFPIHFRVEATDQLGHTQVKEWDASLDDASPSHGSAEANAVGPLDVPQAEDDYSEDTLPELDVPAGGDTVEGSAKAAETTTPKVGVRAPTPQGERLEVIGAQAAQAAAAAANSGTPYVTIGSVKWSDIERTNTSPENFDWEPFDTVIRAYQAAGVKVRSIKVLDAPKWANPDCADQVKANPDGPDNVKMCPPTPFHDDDLRQFAKAVARHYGPSNLDGTGFKIQHVAFWNEPNLKQNWGYRKGAGVTAHDLAQDYSGRLTVFYNAVNSTNDAYPGDPSMTVDAGEIAAGGSLDKGDGPRKWATEFDSFNHGNNYDVFTIHAYSQLPRQIPRKVSNYRQQMEGARHIGVTEFGWGLEDPATYTSGDWKCVTWDATGEPSSSGQATYLTNTPQKFADPDKPVSVTSLTWFNLIDSKKGKVPPCPDKTWYSDGDAQGNAAWKSTNTLGLYRRDKNGNLPTDTDSDGDGRLDWLNPYSLSTPAGRARGELLTALRDQ
ncbi:MAG TPA: glycosyl hydrolase, partial [Solirubrobacterales bacterium]|nr:glycosyl hydrolase [Solirubrobacterales bacterium]